MSRPASNDHRRDIPTPSMNSQPPSTGESSREIDLIGIYYTLRWQAWIVLACAEGLDNKTVATVRAEMEATAEIPRFEKTTGDDGKERPARRADNGPAAEPAPEPVEPDGGRPTSVPEASAASSDGDKSRNKTTRNPAAKASASTPPETALEAWSKQFSAISNHLSRLKGHALAEEVKAVIRTAVDVQWDRVSDQQCAEVVEVLEAAVKRVRQRDSAGGGKQLAMMVAAGAA